MFHAYSISLLGLTALLPFVTAHMEMKSPLPIASKFDPLNTGADVDYNMMRPLDPSGSDYPCLGHHLEDSHVTATFKAGSEYDLEVDGSAVHGGGSCQLSLSYDNGESFKVIKSIIGNCPIQKSYKFAVPSDTPAGKDVLFAWTWFNKLGNREMYMNCARVDIENSSTKAKRSLNAFPEMFRANTYGESCVVAEGTDFVYQHPGSEVEYGLASLEGTAPTEITGCPAGTSSGADSNVDADTEPASSAPAAASSAVSSIVEPPTSAPVAATSIVSLSLSIATPAAPTTTNIVVPTAAAPTYSGFATVTRPATPSTPAATSNSADRSSTDIKCSTDGASFSMFVNGAYVSMGKVAEGTVCRNGAISRASTIDGASDCSTAGEVKCLLDGAGWALCSQGAWIDMGSVAAGMECKDGKIGAA